MAQKMTLTTDGILSTVNGYGNSGTSDNTFIPYPNAGRFQTTTSTYTGYLVITLPQSWSSTMMSFWVDIYNYYANSSVSYFISGYNYSSSKWISCSAVSLGQDNIKQLNSLTVRFGHNGTKCAIYIGEKTTSWNYPQVVIRDLSVGYSNNEYSKWYTGWSVDFSTTLGTITATINNAGLTSSHFLNAYVGAAGTRPTSANLVPVINEYGGMRKDVSTSSMTTAKPPWDGHILTFFWDNSGRYDSQLASRHTTGELAVRGNNDGTWSAWRNVYDTSHIQYGTAAPASGFSGTPVAGDVYIQYS